MTPSQNAIDLIKRFEGCRLKAYRDTSGILTIGWGCVSPDVKEGTVWTQEQADKQLSIDVEEKSAKYISEYVTVPLTQNQFDALTCFVYNIGCGAFKKSKVLAFLNASWYDMVPTMLMCWNRSGGVESRGLTARREAEIELWNS